MKQSLKEWQLESGIKIIKPLGFQGTKSKLYVRLYSKKSFAKGLKNSLISVKTEKGLEFLREEVL